GYPVRGLLTTQGFTLLHIHSVHKDTIHFSSFPLIFPTLTMVFHDITKLDIKRSTFSTPHHLIALLAHLPRLENVKVEAAFSPDWPSSQVLPVPPEPPRSLKTVQLFLSNRYGDPWSCILDWIVQGPLTVRALALHGLPSKSLLTFRTLLCTLGPTLHTLYLYPCYNVSSQTDLSPHFGCLTQLRHLEICVDSLQHDPAHLDAYSALLDALPREPAVLKILTLHILYVGTFTHLVSLDWVRFCAAARAHTRLRLLRFLADGRTPKDRAVLEELRNRVAKDLAATVSVEVKWDEPLL
ncbi:hypothetical protein GGX14DRAFT_671589, partial [Mycena pura]